MAQEILSNLAILSESATANQFDMDKLISEFISLKARKLQF